MTDHRLSSVAPTSDGRCHTPASLRALDNDLFAILADGEDRSGAAIGYVRRSVAAHADAWEAEVDQMSQSYHTLSVAYNATCKRLETVEKVAKDYMDAPNESVPKVMAHKALAAALAGEDTESSTTAVLRDAE